MIFYIFTFAFLVFVFVFQFTSRKKSREKIDGVETIDGIRYLVSNTDVNYVMYKLGSTINSKIIKETSFIKINDHEGILKFGGIAYHMGMNGSEGDMNIGAAYRIRCIQHEGDVVMEISFEHRDFTLGSPSLKPPGLELNQAYHRFFKEIFDVKVIL